MPEGTGHPPKTRLIKVDKALTESSRTQCLIMQMDLSQQLSGIHAGDWRLGKLIRLASLIYSR